MASFMLKVEFYFTNSRYSCSQLRDEEEILTDDSHPPSARGEGVAQQCEARSHEYSTVQTEVTLGGLGPDHKQYIRDTFPTIFLPVDC